MKRRPARIVRAAVEVLPPHDLVVFGALTRHADKHGVARITQERIAAEIGWTRGQVGRSIARLGQYGFVSTVGEVPRKRQVVNRQVRIPMPGEPFAMVPADLLLAERLVGKPRVIPATGQTTTTVKPRWAHFGVAARALLATPDSGKWRRVEQLGMRPETFAKGCIHLQALGIDLERTARGTYARIEHSWCRFPEHPEAEPSATGQYIQPTGQYIPPEPFVPLPSTTNSASQHIPVPLPSTHSEVERSLLGEGPGLVCREARGTQAGYHRHHEHKRKDPTHSPCNECKSAVAKSEARNRLARRTRGHLSLLPESEAS